MSKSIVAALLAVAAGIVASTAAEARGGHHHHHRGVYFYRAPIIVTRVPDCGYAFARWQATGSRYWKYRYFECRGW